MYAIDTNIFVYAHNVSSPLLQKAKSFLEHIVANVNGTEKTVIGIPLQVWAEFVNVCTRKNIGKPLSIPEAIKVVRKYTEILRIEIIYPKPTQLKTFLNLLETTTTRKRKSSTWRWPRRSRTTALRGFIPSMSMISRISRSCKSRTRSLEIFTFPAVSLS